MIFSILGVTLFFVVYAVVHSWLASLPVKRRARQMFGPASCRWYRLFYNIFAVITLLPLLVLLVVLPDTTLYVVPSPWRWLMLGGQLLAVIGLGIAFLQSDPFHFAGIAQLFAESPRENSPLIVTGFYKWVRHPLYFFSLLFIWLTPLMTLNLFVTYLLFTIYFYWGSIYEEKRLVAEFGEIYQTYQQRVPRLIPLPGRYYR